MREIQHPLHRWLQLYTFVCTNHGERFRKTVLALIGEFSTRWRMRPAHSRRHGIGEARRRRHGRLSCGKFPNLDFQSLRMLWTNRLRQARPPTVSVPKDADIAAIERSYSSQRSTFIADKANVFNRCVSSRHTQHAFFCSSMPLPALILNA